eukprot:SAG31_NODE_5488_length_2511_cov_1.810531_2_plen_89_part_00
MGGVGCFGSWDEMAKAVGPRPDTVTSDNLRSSRKESHYRKYNPGCAASASCADAQACHTHAKANRADYTIILLFSCVQRWTQESSSII